MSNDDDAVGRVLTRREALALLGLSGMALLARRATADGAGPCVVRPQQTEGPYFVEGMLDRSDIRSDPTDGATRPGAPLELIFNVTRLTAAGCVPLPGMVVDVWHCDHLGVYSDVRDPAVDTVGKKFLRGYQHTDDGGRARFTTIYPGWYRGRTVHIHFKIRSAPAANPGFEFTSQLYFDDAITDLVYAQPPYAARGRRTIRNSRDGIYADGGADLMLALAQTSSGTYVATFEIALQV